MSTTSPSNVETQKTEDVSSPSLVKRFSVKGKKREDISPVIGMDYGKTTVYHFWTNESILHSKDNILFPGETKKDEPVKNDEPVPVTEEDFGGIKVYHFWK